MCLGHPEKSQNPITRELLDKALVFPDDRFHSIKNLACDLLDFLWIELLCHRSIS